MEYNNINFLEEYKRLDNLCQQIYHADNESGITSYINDMDSKGPQERSKVPNYNSALQRLKYLRGLRNKMIHELDTLNRNMCTKMDIDWITDFHQRILRREDPLATLHQNTPLNPVRINVPSVFSKVSPQPVSTPTRRKSNKAYTFAVIALIIIILVELVTAGLFRASLK